MDLVSGLNSIIIIIIMIYRCDDVIDYKCSLLKILTCDIFKSHSLNDTGSVGF